MSQALRRRTRRRVSMSSTHSMRTRSSARKQSRGDIRRGGDEVESLTQRFRGPALKINVDDDEADNDGCGQTFKSPKVVTQSLEELYPEGLRVHGSGKFGTVYVAKRPGTQTQVAVKHIPIRASDKKDRCKRIELAQREIEIATQLSQSCTEACGIVRVYDAWTDAGLENFYIEMDFIDGGSGVNFRQALKQLPQDKRVALFVSNVLHLVRTLQYIHDQGVLHRDIKTDNLLYDKRRGQLVFSDFGISCLRTAPTCKSASGTPQKMDPTTTLAFRENDLWADVYGLGLALYEMYFDELPFEQNSAVIEANYKRAEQQIDREVRDNLKAHPCSREFIAFEAIKRMMDPFDVTRRPALRNIALLIQTPQPSDLLLHEPLLASE